MTATELLLTTHAAVTGAMAGLIWFVQIVHYPLLAAVGTSGFAGYHRAHVARTGRLVGPLMLAELATAGALPFVALPPPGRILAVAGLGLLGVTWASTFLVQVPEHRRLASGGGSVSRLVRTNWVRTAAWTARFVIALRLLAPGT